MKTNRYKRHKRIRNKISGTEGQPRIAVFRSNKNIQVQLINDDAHKTLLGMSSAADKDAKGTKTEKAKVLGIEFGKKVASLEGGKYKKVAFDRGGYKYHGRVKALADGLRESGLEF
jgi:large subunit ribosomal protein L18